MVDVADVYIVRAVQDASELTCTSIAGHCSSVHCSVVQFSAVQFNLVQFSAVQCSAVQCSSIQISSFQCSAVQCSAVQWPSGSNCDCHRCSCLQQMSSLATSDDWQFPHVQAANISPQCPPPSDSSMLLDGPPLGSGAPGSGAGSSLERTEIYIQQN